MEELNETQVFILVRKYLIENNWQVIGGQPPSGTDHLPVIEIRDPMYKGNGSKGSYKPDLIAWYESKLVIIELKPSFNNPDRDKVNKVLNSPERIGSLWESLIQRNITLGKFGRISEVQGNSRVVGGLGYGGTRVDHGDGHVVQVQEFKSQSTLASTHVQHTATRGHLCTAKGRDEESSKRCSATAAIFVVASAMLLAAYLKCV